MATTLVDSQTGEVLNEIQIVEKLSDLKKQRQGLTNQIKSLEIQIFQYMEELKATKRPIGDYQVTVENRIKRTFSEDFYKLVNVIGPDRFISLVKVTPKWRETSKLLKEGGEVREIIENSLTEEVMPILKIEGGSK